LDRKIKQRSERQNGGTIARGGGSRGRTWATWTPSSSVSCILVYLFIYLFILFFWRHKVTYIHHNANHSLTRGRKVEYNIYLFCSIYFTRLFFIFIICVFLSTLIYFIFKKLRSKYNMYSFLSLFCVDTKYHQSNWKHLCSKLLHKSRLSSDWWQWRDNCWAASFNREPDTTI
jgi:hypothetical protein